MPTPIKHKAHAIDASNGTRFKSTIIQVNKAFQSGSIEHKQVNQKPLTHFPCAFDAKQSRFDRLRLTQKAKQRVKLFIGELLV